MRKHLTFRNLISLATLLGALALHGDTLADDATCANLSGSYAAGLFPGGEGDEGFFGLPVGVPGNAMIILDNSGSMMDFPGGLPAAPSAGKGNCTDATWAARKDLRKVDPYDNGTTNTFTTDNPPWGLSRCTGNKCIFKSTAYYKYQEWNDDSATQYASGTASGQICYGVPVGTTDDTTCQKCLDNVGYFAYTTSTGTKKYLFKGDYLNGYPPKYVIARKVVKNLVAIDQTTPAPTDNVRFGLTIFLTNNNGNQSTGLGSDDGGKLVVPLGPNCDLSQAGYVAGNSTQMNAYQQVRQAIIDAVNDPNLVSFGTNTPLGETLFNVGQYFSDTRGCPSSRTGCDPTGGNVNGPVYDYMFGTSWTRSTFYETSAGAVSAPWVSSGRQESVCWSCQQSSAIIVTDGMPVNDSNVPRSGTTSNHTASPVPGTASSTATNDFRKWTDSALTVPGCTNCGSTILQKVAYFLWKQDMRPDYSNVRQSQSVATYAISFGIPDDSDADALLEYTAKLGGGKYWNTSSGDELQSALQMAVTDTIARSNSFSVSNTNTLQTGNNNQLLLARFRKTQNPLWEGHLYRYKIFNEFVQGCDTTKPTAAQTTAKCYTANGTEVPLNPNLNGDTDASGNAVCEGLFVLDADCSPVVEDANGDFRKATLDATTHQFTTTTTAEAANAYWDAGEALSYKTFPPDYPVVSKRGKTNAAFRSADAAASNKRVIYTTLVGSGTAAPVNALVEFTPANAAQIAPYLDLNGQMRVGSTTVNFCAYLLQRAGLCGTSESGDPFVLPACPVPDATTKKVSTADEQKCAVQLINYIRGWDVLDDDGDGCGGPGNPRNPYACPGGSWNAAAVAPTPNYTGGGDGEERIRGNFHGTSPDTGTVGDYTNDNNVVQQFWKLGDIFHSSPILVKPPASEFVCDLALEPACVSTIHSPQLPNTQPTPADWDANGNGSIEAGENAYTVWRKTPTVAQRQQIALVGSNDGMLHAFDAGVRDPSKSVDWLGTYPFTPGSGAELWAYIPPDLLPKLKLALDNHTYFVDGDTMVRDVWVDNSPRDGKREPTEFHTVAVIAERSGGVHYTALDITDTTKPRFLWMFPPNGSVAQNLTGQTWTSFAPRPPPIGPIRLATSDSTIDPTNRKFEERWVVALNGGFDATLTRGRGVWMLDVWTGELIWKYTDDDLKANIGAKANMWPVPATVAFTDIGDADQAIIAGDGYFDTANWGDMGGSLFVARMKAPGIRGSNGVVNNWYVARAFEEQRQTTDDQLFAGRTEFFHMSANAIHLRTGIQHTYLGGGNRDELLQSGAACGPNNVLGCFQAGCTGDVTTKSTYAACSVTNKVTATGGKMVFSTTSTTCADPHSCGSLSSNVQLSLTCSNSSGSSTGSFTASMTCDADGQCSSRSPMLPTSLFANRLNTPAQQTRFYGIWSYGATRIFSDAATAKAFDGLRLTDIPYAPVCTGTAGNACTLIDTTRAQVSPSGAVTCPGLATGAICAAAQWDPGWMYQYGVVCPMGAGNCTDPLPWSDERTASGQTLIGNCVDWNTFRPRGSNAAAALDPCAAADTTKARNYTYLADFIKGVPQPGCGFAVGTTEIARSTQRTTIAPPPDPTQLIGVGMDGEVKMVGAQIEPGTGASTTAIGSKRDMLQPVYWLDVDPSMHQCRHVDSSSCQ